MKINEKSLEILNIHNTYEIGQLIKFGKYYWYVLFIQNEKALILCANIIERRAYNDKKGVTTWKDCTLRQYLNTNFFDSFNPHDKNRIVEVRIINSKNPWDFGTIECCDTKDRIFLLSIDEIVNYFGDSKKLKNKDPKNKFHIDDVFNPNRIAKYKNNKNCRWWLRSPGKDNTYAANIDEDGYIRLYGDIVYNKKIGIRPALWIDLLKNYDSTKERKHIIYQKDQSNDNKDCKRNLPLTDLNGYGAYDFLTDKKFQDIIDKMEEIKPGNRSSSARRGLFIIKCKEKEILQEFIDNYWPFGKTKSGEKAIESYIQHYYKYTEIKQEPTKNNKANPTNTNSVKKPTSHQSPIKSTIDSRFIPVQQDEYHSKSLEIAQRCEKLVRNINKIRNIFDNSQKDLWLDIREPCKSESDFIKSITDLCILVKEKTRDRNPNFKPGTKNGPYYTDRFPDNSLIEQFKKDVEIIRNYHLHEADKDIKIKYIKIFNEFTKIDREPINKEEFQRFQDNILSKFESALKELFEML